MRHSREHSRSNFLQRHVVAIAGGLGLLVVTITAMTFSHLYSAPNYFVPGIGAALVVCVLFNVTSLVVVLALLAVARFKNGATFFVYALTLVAWAAYSLFVLPEKYGP
jgi:hypothetical protein